VLPSHRLDRTNSHFHNDIAHLAVMSRSDHAKQHLITLLSADDNWVFWPVYGLLAGWGMEDAEVARALLAAAERPPVKAQYFAHHLPQIIWDKAACRAKLLEVARLEMVERLDFLIAGFARLGASPEDPEVMEAILRHDFSQRGVFDATDSLISGFGTHPAVRAIALTRLKELDAAWDILIGVYADDQETRSTISRFLSSLPTSVRGVFVSSLHRRASEDEALAKRLLQYQVEANPAVRTASAIAYYEAIAADEKARPAAVARLKRETTAIGPWMDITRQSAFAGFIALDKVSVFRELPDGWRPGQKVTLDVLTLDNNSPVLAYIAKHWDRLTIALGPDVFERLTRHSNEWWWDHLAACISESAPLRTDFLATAPANRKSFPAGRWKPLVAKHPDRICCGRIVCVASMEPPRHQRLGFRTASVRTCRRENTGKAVC
jgi:hypothetical protein